MFIKTLCLISVLLTTSLVANTSQISAAPSPNTTLLIKNIRTVKGTLFIAAYDTKKDWLKEGKESVAIQERVLTKPAQEVHLYIPKGHYALTLYHDENNNGKMDKKRLVIPKEPYGVSNNKIRKFAPPSFKQNLVEISPSNNYFEIELYL